ncbi:MAG: pitrilysin family protein [Acidobacteriota bacterium]
MSAPVAHPSAALEHALRGDERTLANGLRVVLLPDRRVPLIALELRLEAGSRHDPPGRSGMAHLVEHLVFSGPALEEHESKDGQGGGGLPALLQRRGGWAGASTAPDHVAYRDLLPAAELPLGLWVIAQRLRAASAGWLLERSLIERRVLRQERRQTIGGSPYGRAAELLHARLYPAGHPYHRSTSGLPDEIAAISDAEIEAFVARRYDASRAVVVLAGDFTVPPVRRQLEEVLGTLETRPKERGRSPGATTEQSDDADRAHAAEEIQVDAPRTRIDLALRAPGFGRKGWYAATLLVAALSTGSTSPLRRRLIDKAKVAHTVSARLISLRDASTMVLSTTAAPGVDAERLRAAVDDAIDEVLQRPLEREVLERARRAVLTRHFRALQNLLKRAAVGARLVFDLDRPPHLDVEAERYLRVGTDDLLLLGNSLRRGSRRATVTFTPRSPRS